jgi:hypothetical protein
MTAAPYQTGNIPISNLPALPGIAISSFDELAIVDVDAQETKKITAEAFLQGALALLPPGSIDGNLITYPETPTVDPNSIADGSITAAKLADNSSGIYASTLPASGDFVGQACILSNGKVYFWTGTEWLAANSAADGTKITGDELADNSSGVWTENGDAPESDGNFIGQIAVTTEGEAYMWNGTEWYALKAEVADGSITGEKMADNSTAVFYTEGESNIQGEFIGQLAIDDAEGRAYAWTGTEWISLTSADAYTGTTGDVVDIAIDATTREISASLQDTTDANQFLAGPIEAGGTVGYREIDSSDLPLAISGSPGAISPGPSVSVTNGVLDLVVQGAGQELEYHLVSYNEYGIVTASAALADAIVIPPATESELGGIIVGEGLSVTPEGLLSVNFTDNVNIPIASDTTLGGVIIGGGIAISESGVISLDSSVTAGTYTKVTTDAYGLVIEGAQLDAGDIPALDADKIVSGEINPLRIGDFTIERRMMADYSVTFIQETAPTLNVGAIGGLWLKESTGALSVFNGNRWVSVSGSGGGTGGGTTDPTVGLRYGGVIDGTTGLLAILTTEGLGAGFTAGQAPGNLVTSDNEGIYFVVNPAGDQIAELPGQATSVGDWMLAASVDAGWTWVDRSGGGGGGLDPSTITLNELADVDADAPLDGDCLIYNGTSQIYQTRKINLDEIGEVAINAPSDNQVLKYSGGSWINADAPSGGGETISSDAPSDGKQYARQNEGWTEIVQPETPPAGSTIPIVSETPPASPTVGDIWVRPSNLRQYVYMTDDGGSSQWASLMCC